MYVFFHVFEDSLGMSSRSDISPFFQDGSRLIEEKRRPNRPDEGFSIIFLLADHMKYIVNRSSRIAYEIDLELGFLMKMRM